MVIKILGLFLLCAFFAGTGCSSARVQEKAPQLEYAYSDLKLLDLEQMSDLIQTKMRLYKKSGQAAPAEEALTICLSRPDSDSLIEKLIGGIRYGLESNELWESITKSVVQKSLKKLDDPATAVTDQVTYLTILENIIAEFRPEFVKQYQSPMFESRIIESIARTDIEVSQEASSESRLNLMTEPRSPSEVASELLEERTSHLKGRK